MKKIIALILALTCAVLCFASCGKKDPPVEKNDDPVGKKLSVEGLPFEFRLEADESGQAATATIELWTEITGIITIPETVEYNSHVYPITKIGLGTNIMMTEPSALKTLVLSKNVKEIAESAFAMCNNLSLIRFSEGLEKIGDSAFWGTALETLEFPSSLKSIGKSSFMSNRSLTSVTFNADIETIADTAFGFCVNIETISIPRRFRGNLNAIFSNIGDTPASDKCVVTSPD